MSYFDSLLLGFLQGATEFLPVSSSGHLLVLEHFRSLPEQERMALAAALHIGTAVAVLVFFGRRLGRVLAGVFHRQPERRREGWRLVGHMGVSSLPAVVVGLALRDVFRRVFASPGLAAVLLLVTGALLFVTRFVPTRDRGLNWWRALLVGLAQAAAILPGISRSGATISTGVFTGLSNRDAFDYSFLLSVPVILGAAALELTEISLSAVGVGPLLLGVVMSFVVGLTALALLRGAVVSRRLHWFSYYCWAAGLALLVLLGLGF